MDGKNRQFVSKWFRQELLTIRLLDEWTKLMNFKIYVNMVKSL